MIALILVMTILVLLVINTKKIPLLKGKSIKINSNLVILFFLISLLCLNTMKEKFEAIPESKVIGITGPSTIDTLQKAQDKEIQNLENLYNTVDKMYCKKEEAMKSEKYKKIPIESSCSTLGNTDTLPQDFSNSQNRKTVNALTSNELLAVLKKT